MSKTIYKFQRSQEIIPNLVAVEVLRGHKHALPLRVMAQKILPRIRDFLEETPA